MKVRISIIVVASILVATQVEPFWGNALKDGQLTIEGYRATDDRFDPA